MTRSREVREAEHRAQPQVGPLALGLEGVSNVALARSVAALARTMTAVPPPGFAAAIGRLSAAPRARVLSRDDAPPGAPSPAPGSATRAPDADVEALVGPMNVQQLSALRADIQARRTGKGEKLKLAGGDRDLDDALARAVLNRVRTVVMERLAESRSRILMGKGDVPEMRDLDATDRHRATDPQTRKQLLADGMPYLDELRKPKHPRDASADVETMDHKDPRVMEAVRATFGLAIGANAEQALADFQKGDTSMRTKALGIVSGQPPKEQNWCGAFAQLVSQKAGAKDAAGSLPLTAPEFSDFKGAAPHVPSDSLDAVFSYTKDHTIVVGGVPKPVSQYHKERGSLRSLLKLPEQVDVATAASLDIQPGDIILLDLKKGTYAEHIQVCTGYDPMTGQLDIVGGNQGGLSPQTSVISAGSSKIVGQPGPNDAAKLAKGETKHARVYARARFSLVDFEPHEFKK